MFGDIHEVIRFLSDFAEKHGDSKSIEVSEGRSGYEDDELIIYTERDETPEEERRRLAVEERRLARAEEQRAKTARDAGMMRELGLVEARLIELRLELWGSK